jgi:hypothetical protein
MCNARLVLSGLALLSSILILTRAVNSTDTSPTLLSQEPPQLSVEDDALKRTITQLEEISNSPLILLSMLSALVHGLLLICLPVVIFASNKQKTVNLIKSKTAC